MITGIEFFNKKEICGFKDCEETIKFIKIMNNLFDAFNRRFPGEGMKKSGQDVLRTMS